MIETRHELNEELRRRGRGGRRIFGLEDILHCTTTVINIVILTTKLTC